MTNEQILGPSFYPHECGGMIECVTKQDALSAMDAARKDVIENLIKTLDPEYMASRLPYFKSDSENNACVAGAEFVLKILKSKLETNGK